MEEIDLKEFIKLFLEKKFLIIIITVIFMIIGGIYSFRFITPLYKSSTTLVLTKINYNDITELIDPGESITQADVTLNQKLVGTYSKIIKSSAILETVVENLKDLNLSVEGLKGSISVNNVEDTEVIEISVINQNPEHAARIANEVSKTFEKKVREMYKIDNVYTLDVAKISNKPYNINHPKDIVLAGAAGIIISVICIVIINIFDNTTKNKDEIEKLLKVPVVGTLLKNESNKKREQIITKIDPRSPLTESIKTLRTNLQFMSKNKGTQTILVTSTLPSEGKSWVSLNLAIAFAQTGKKTIIVDADMRKEKFDYTLNLSITPGLSNYLSGVNVDEEQGIYSIVQRTQIDNLFAVTSGDMPPNPSELIVSEKMQDLINELEDFADVVIFDSPPAVLVSDAVVLSRSVNSTIIISQYNKTKMNYLKQVKESVENVGGKVAGIVLNQLPIKKGDMYGYNYNYYGSTKKISNRIKKASKIIYYKRYDVRKPSTYIGGPKH